MEEWDRGNVLKVFLFSANILLRDKPPANIEIHFHLLQAKFFATQLRPSSAPVRRIISLMDNQEPVFATTDQMSDPQIKDVYPHKVGLEYKKISLVS